MKVLLHSLRSGAASIQSTGLSSPSKSASSGSTSTAAGNCGAWANHWIRLTTPVPPDSRRSSWKRASSRGSSQRTAQRRSLMGTRLDSL